MMSRLKNINIAVCFNSKVIQKVFTIVRIIDYNYNGLFPVRDKFRYIEKLEMTFDFKMTVDSYLRNILLRDDLSKQKGTANNCITILNINNLIVLGFIIAHRQDRDITE